ncbi:uncharacterized protein LOC121658442 [Corvus kubaryi]|uniref:uncharacterized protein LOC121658442 n=1 Tax=Corvus kubaryi TaxID=68294 RepID=UPI001C04CDF5|nr:uncharacterized protein LOC121658442 [Corvus kubaryi]
MLAVPLTAERSGAAVPAAHGERSEGLGAPGRRLCSPPFIPAPTKPGAAEGGERCRGLRDPRGRSGRSPGGRQEPPQAGGLRGARSAGAGGPTQVETPESPLVYVLGGRRGCAQDQVASCIQPLCPWLPGEPPKSSGVSSLCATARGGVTPDLSWRDREQKRTPGVTGTDPAPLAFPPWCRRGLSRGRVVQIGAPWSELGPPSQASPPFLAPPGVPLHWLLLLGCGICRGGPGKRLIGERHPRAPFRGFEGSSDPFAVL